jgi:hypothetical protein
LLTQATLGSLKMSTRVMRNQRRDAIVEALTPQPSSAIKRMKTGFYQVRRVSNVMQPGGSCRNLGNARIKKPRTNAL